jgi:hypothetical protein
MSKEDWSFCVLADIVGGVELDKSTVWRAVFDDDCIICWKLFMKSTSKPYTVGVTPELYR